MINIDTNIKDYELCNLCNKKPDVKIGFVDSEHNTTTKKLCAECTYELYKELHEHQMDKIITEVNKGK